MPVCCGHADWMRVCGATDLDHAWCCMLPTTKEDCEWCFILRSIIGRHSTVKWESFFLLCHLPDNGYKKGLLQSLWHAGHLLFHIIWSLLQSAAVSFLAWLWYLYVLISDGVLYVAHNIDSYCRYEDDACTPHARDLDQCGMFSVMAVTSNSPDVAFLKRFISQISEHDIKARRTCDWRFSGLQETRSSCWGWSHILFCHHSMNDSSTGFRAQRCRAECILY